MRIKAVQALVVLGALALVAVCVAWWKFPLRSTALLSASPDNVITTNKDSENSTLKPSKELADSKAASGAVDDEELDDLLQVLKARQDNYTGPTLNWTSNACTPTTRRSRTCFDTACPRQFSQFSLRERLKQVLSTRAPLPEKYMRALASAARSVASHKYIFVTGASSNHFKQIQSLLYTMFNSLLPKMEGEDYVFVVYNLGFTEDERRLMSKNCHCTLLDFPFSEMPEDVQYLKCYVWKALIMASLLEKAEYLTWMDASVRFRDSDPFPELFHRARDNGFQSRINRHSIAVHTMTSMADFYGDHLCQYSPFSEMETGFFILYNDRFTREAIMKPWITCAFTKNCMCVRNHYSCGARSRQYAACHRFEQSGIGMIYSKLYLEKRPMLLVTSIKISKGKTMDFKIAKDKTMDWFH